MMLIFLVKSILMADINFNLKKNIDIPIVNFSIELNKSIYGENSMKDYYEVSPEIKELADSTVVFVRNDAISYDSANKRYVRVKNRSFSQSHYLNEDQDFANQPVFGFCSGALVSKNLVLTAGHCIKEDNYSHVKVVFNWKIEKSEVYPQYFSEDDVYAIKRIVVRKHTDKGTSLSDFINTYKDYAIVELDRNVVDKKPLKVEKSKELSRGDYIFTIGYPAGLAVKITGPYDSVVYIKGETIYKTNTDLLGGNSGGPAFDSKTNKIVGIVVTGEHEYVYKTIKDFIFEVRVDSNISVGNIEFFKEEIPYIKTDFETTKSIIDSFSRKGSKIKCEKEICSVYVYKDTSFTNRETTPTTIMMRLGGKDVMDRGVLITYQHDRYGSGILKILSEFSSYIP